MDAVRDLGNIIKKTAEATKDSGALGCAKLVVFANAPEDNPFMAGAFLGPGEPECVINVGISGPGVVKHALEGVKGKDLGVVAETIKKAAFKITRVGELVAREASERLNVPFGIIDLSLAPTPAVGDSVASNYDSGMISAFDSLIADSHFPWTLESILPRVLCAGQDAGRLTPEGAVLLDPEGDLEPGCPLCPPEGDAGTGMAATNSVRERTGNVSAGTSIFSMIVLEKPMKKVYPEIDIVTTPAGKQVGMVHCNSCTSDINAWVALFREFADLMGCSTNVGDVFTKLFLKSREAEKDCGGLVSFNYLAGEPVTGLSEGRPMFLRLPDARFNLANFMRAQIYASMETLKYGMEIMNRENVAIDCVYGHGGLFKTEGVAQNDLAAAIHAPVTVMETAGEGGAWGIALLADYMVYHADGETLEDYLQDHVFKGMKQITVSPEPENEKGFDRYMERFVSCLPAQRAAASEFKD